MERRKSNLELLRIVSLLMIIVFHCAYKSGFSFDTGFSVNKFVVKMFWMLGELGVNLFMLISGYFMGRFKWKKLIRLLAEVQFYKWFTLFVAIMLGICDIPVGKSLFFSFFPVTWNSWWFITAYLLVYILSPYLNLLIRAMDEKTYRKFLATVLFLFSAIPTCFGFFFNGTEEMLYYNRFIWLIIVYFLGAYLKKHQNKFFLSKVNAAHLSVVSAAVLALSILIIDHFHGFFEWLGTNEIAYFWPPNTIPMVCLSVGIFLLFLHLKIPYHPAINVASTTLGIYLLHDGILQGWLWRQLFRCAEYQNSPFLVLRILIAASVVFVSGSIIDLLRQMLEHCILDPLLNSNAVCVFDTLERRAVLKKLKNILYENRTAFIFCYAFLLYVFLGLCISYYAAFDTNMFFGADNARAFKDLTNIGYNHYRMKVHPLFLLLMEPVVLLIDGAVNRPELSVILLESFCGALSVCLFDMILGQKKICRWIRNMFTFIYSFSFSVIIFSTIPETFIFAALGMLSYWYFISVASAAKEPFSKKEWAILAFFGMICFGMTLTNYAFYLVGLIYLLLCRYKPGLGVKQFLKLNALNTVIIAAACLYQKFVWSSCPLFWTSIYNALTGKEVYEEVSYMNFTISFDKVKQWLKGTVLYPLLSPDMFLKDPGEKYHPILFSGYPMLLKFFLLLFCVALVLFFVVWVIRLREKFFFMEDGYIFSLLFAYAGNLALHYIYGYNEAFIYSPHFLFYLLLAGALILNKIRSHTIEKVALPGGLLFCALEATNNLIRFFKTAQIALETVDASFNLMHSVKGTMMCGALLLAILFCGSRLCPRTLVAAQKGIAPYISKRICQVIAGYGVTVAVVSFFIAFNF